MLNQKAFNLFTALVSFVMILLTVILTNSMTQTEDKAISTLSDLELQSEMQAVADLARGDALQVFIYNLRAKMETWLTKPDNYFPLQPGKTWDELVNDYVALNFGSTKPDPNNPGQTIASGQQFAFEVTQQLSGILAIGTSFGRYSVDLKQNDEDMRKALNKTISNSLQSATNPNQDLFELVGCGSAGNEPTGCDPGTFYINLDLSLGAFDSQDLDNDNAIYESLPKIIVRRVGTAQTLETAILPRSKIKIYVPLRIFKAVFAAKQTAETNLFDSTTTGSQFKNALRDLGVGMCDATCTVRQGTLQPPGGTWNHACPFTPNAPNLTLQTAAYNVQLGGVNPNGTYDPGFGGDALSDMQNKLRMVFEKILCSDAQSLANTVFENTNPFSSGANPNPVQCDFVGDVRAIQTKEIGLLGGGSFGTTNQSYCVRLESLALDLKYKENDKLYRVNEHVDQPNSGLYTIRIIDTTYNQPAAPNPLPTCNTTCADPNCNIGTCG